MLRRPLLLPFLALPLAAQAPNQPALAETLGFEAPPNGACPGGWSCSVPGTIAADSDVVHGGNYSARIERKADSPQQFSTVTKSMPMDFGCRTLELSGFIRTERVQDFVAFWMREDGPTGSVGFASMQGRQVVKGDTPWTEYSISLPVNRDGRTLFFGFLLSGAGRAWTDDLRLLVDGKPVWEAPKVDRPKTIIETDQQFDRGSGLTLDNLSPLQVENLTTLGKVWGFLKYHHPQVTAGTRHFDYDLLRVLPQILSAGDRDTANARMLGWIGTLGEVTPCRPCARLDESDLSFRPDLEWISDETALGPDLSRTLRKIRDNRTAGAKQFYVSLAPGIGNPVFQNEPVYNNVRLPDPGFQILALYRYWNIIEYWYPYRDLIGDRNWSAALTEFLPRIAEAKDRDSYQREMMQLIARIQDTHANLWSSLAVRPPVGACQVPVVIRFIENRPVVAAYSNSELGKATGLQPGDDIQQLDGVDVSKRVQQWIPYYAASNETTRLRDIGNSLTKGDCAQALSLRVRRGAATLDLQATRVMPAQIDAKISATHDRPGDAFQLLSPDVAYLKLSAAKMADAPRYVNSAAKKKGLIIDIRNYPSEFMVFALGELLVDRSTDFARFTAGDLSNPGAFEWADIENLQPKEPHYTGKIVVLVDETSQSQAEYTAMAFRAAHATVIGSTTAAADGNVSQIPLPGGLSTMISGIGVFYPDKKPTQRLGIVPDREVRPTIAGIRDGRDEVLEAAVREVLGAATPDAVVRKVANGK